MVGMARKPPSEFNGLVSERVAHLLELRGVERDALAEALGHSRHVLERKLSNERQWVADDAVVMRDLFRTTLSYLFLTTDDPEPPAPSDPRRDPPASDALAVPVHHVA